MLTHRLPAPKKLNQPQVLRDGGKGTKSRLHQAVVSSLRVSSAFRTAASLILLMALIAMVLLAVQVDNSSLEKRQCLLVAREESLTDEDPESADVVLPVTSYYQLPGVGRPPEELIQDLAYQNWSSSAPQSVPQIRPLLIGSGCRCRFSPLIARIGQLLGPWPPRLGCTVLMSRLVLLSL